MYVPARPEVSTVGPLEHSLGKVPVGLVVSLETTEEGEDGSRRLFDELGKLNGDGEAPPHPRFVTRVLRDDTGNYTGRFSITATGSEPGEYTFRWVAVAGEPT
jgi:hypothetical protein